MRTCGRGSALPRDACRRCLARKSARTRFAFGFETSPARLGGPARPGEGGAPLPPDVECKGRANTPAGCARSVGFAADLRRGSLCGVQRGCRRARMWRAVHASGATVVCGTRVGHGAGRETRVWTLVRECNQPAMIIRWSCGRSLGSGDDRLCSTQFQTVVSGLGSSGCAIIDVQRLMSVIR